MTARALDLDALEAAAKKATPGPWYDKDDPGANCEECGESLPLQGGVVFSSVTSGGVATIDEGGYAAADRAYIAAASPDVILQLVKRVRELERERDEARAHAWPWNGSWGLADQHLAEAQRLVEEMQKNNDDTPYGLLRSAHDHIIEARGDLDADLK